MAIKNTVINTEWVKQDNWHGNPAIGLVSYMKHFRNNFTNRNVPIFIYGCAEPITYKNDMCDSVYHGFNFIVSAGAYSEYSYSGGFPENIRYDIEKCKEYIDTLYNTGKLIK
jgi:hypothetical protein